MNNPWQDWLAQAQAKQDQRLPKRIRVMHTVYGRAGIDKRCGACRHLRRIRYQKTFYKCGKTTITHGAATDWRVGWPACGLYETRTEEVETWQAPE
jgi:hypothetical protein